MDDRLNSGLRQGSRTARDSGGGGGVKTNGGGCWFSSRFSTAATDNPSSSASAVWVRPKTVLGARGMAPRVSVSGRECVSPDSVVLGVALVKTCDSGGKEEYEDVPPPNPDEGWV